MKRLWNKSYWKKGIAAGLCAALLTVSTGLAAYKAGERAGGDGINASGGALQSGAGALLSEGKESSRAQKEETVYVFADANGSVSQLLVYDWLKNTAYDERLDDVSELSDIELVKGSAAMSAGAQGAVQWSTGGEDVYYRGVSAKELPVTIKVTYQLDGKTVAPEELRGKSGHVKICYSFENHQKQTVEVDGEKLEVVVPFAMVTGMILDNQCFRNITVSNGKLVNDGDHTVVVGFALPGLQEGLELSEELLTLPESVTLEADVTDFKLGNVMTFGTSSLFAGLDLSAVEGDFSAEDAVSELSSAMSQLLDGSSQLYDGMRLLLEKSQELSEGVDALAAGAAQLNGGKKELSDGVGALDQGLAELEKGLAELDGNSAALNAGGKQVFESLLAMGNSAIAEAGLQAESLTMENYESVLQKLLAGLSDANLQKMAEAKALETVTQQVNSQRDAIAAQVRAAAYEQVLAAVLKTQGMTVEQYEQALAAGLIDKTTQTAVEKAVEQQLESLTEQKVQELIETNMNSSAVQAQIKAGVAEAKEGVASLRELLQNLKAYDAFYQGLRAYTAGVGTAEDGASRLAAGSKKLVAGMKTFSEGIQALADGLGSLQEGCGQLGEGIAQLTDGSMQLSEGLQQLQTEGLEPILTLLEEDGQPLLLRLKATMQAAKEYRSFSGISDSMDGSVKFIYKLGSIE